MKRLSKKRAKDIFDEGISLFDCPIDVNEKREQQSNGSVEHLVTHQDKFYFVHMTWQEEVLSAVEYVPNFDERGYIEDEIEKYQATL